MGRRQLWAGVDVGKRAHHCVVIDNGGARLFSQRVANTEADLLALIDAVTALQTSSKVTWAVDINRGAATVLVTLLHQKRRQVVYLPGRTFHFVASTYPSEQKSDAKDAAIIADYARVRRDLQLLRAVDPVTAELRLLITKRISRVEDRARAVNRLRHLLVESFPALESTFDFAHSQGALLLLTQFNTPDSVRDAGVTAIAEWLREAGARISFKVATKAVEAAAAQQVSLPGRDVASALVRDQAQDILNLRTRASAIEDEIETCFARHRYAALITSMPGFGITLGAEFIAASGGDMRLYASANQLAAASGLAPVARDSGDRRHKHRRPYRYDRRLLRACYLSAYQAVRYDATSTAYYDRKIEEGKHHIQAVLSLARRRSNVLWAMLRDNKPYEARAPRLSGVAPGHDYGATANAEVASEGSGTVEA